MDQLTFIDRIITRTSDLCRVEVSEGLNGFIEYRFDTRIICGDFLIVQLQRAAMDDVMEKAARAVLRNELMEMFKSEIKKQNCFNDLYYGCVEALSLFDNYPQCHESVGTFEVLTNAVSRAQGAV